MAKPVPEHTTDATNEGSKTPTISTGNQVSEATAVHESVVRWLNQMYLVLDHYGDPLSITVDDFLHILDTSATNSGRSWLSDDQITLPMILQLEQESKRSEMLIVTPTAAMILAAIGVGLNDLANFVSAAPDLYEAMIDGDARWIVIPCNDGMVKTLNAESKYNQAQERANAEEQVAEDQAAEDLRNERDGRSTTKVQQADEKNSEHNDIPTTAAKSADDSQPTHDKPSKASRKGVAESGIHWGMLIIDREKADARFFDGDLQLVEESLDGKRLRFRRRSKWPGTAIAAGKILCGYDAVMARPAGQFKTGTLRHTPHDHEHNHYKGDQGSACAPWVFAMLRYILQNPTFLTGENGLKGTFSKDQRHRHIQNLAFNSKTTRRDMQSLLAGQARKVEAANILPHKLDTKILQDIGAITPDVLLYHLRSLEGGNAGSRSTNGLPHKGWHSSDDHGVTDNDDDDGDDKSYKNVLLTDLKPYLSNDTSVTKEIRLEQAYNIYSEAQKNELEEHLGKRSGGEYDPSHQGSNEIIGQAARYAALQDSAAFKAIANHVILFHPMAEHQVDLWVEKNSGHIYFPSDVNPHEKRARLQKAFGGINGSTVRKHAAADYRHNLSMPPGLGHMQIIDALRELTQDVPNLRGQIEWYPDYYLREHGVTAPGEEAGGDHTSSTRPEQGRPSLGRPPTSRVGNKADSLGSSQSDDGEGDPFPKGHRGGNPGQDRGGKLPSLPIPKPNDNPSFDGNDNDDEDDDNDDHTGSKQKRLRDTGAQMDGGHADLEPRVTDSGAPGEELLQDPSGSIINGGAKGNDSPTANNGNDEIAPWDNVHELPQGLLDFRTMSEQDLEQFKDPHWLRDERLRSLNVNTTSWRAFHFVRTSGRHFGDESDANCLNLWLNDTVVFLREERDTIRSQGRIQEIRDRMNTHYRTGPQTQGPGEMQESDTETDSEGDEGGDKPDKASGDTSYIAGKRKRDPTGHEAKSNKRKKTNEGTSPVSDPKKESAGQYLSRLDKTIGALQYVINNHISRLDVPGDFRTTLTAGTDHVGSATPDGGEDNKSSPLSSLPSSEDEWEITGGETSSHLDRAGSSYQGGPVQSGNKRRRDTNMSEAHDQGRLSKKLKTSHYDSSKGIQGGSDDRRNATTASFTSIRPDKSPTIGHASASFDSQATVEVPTVDIRIGQLLYTIRNDDLDVFLPQDTTRNGWPSSATSLPNFAAMGSSLWNDWFLANGTIINPLLQQRGPAQDTITSRALLHMHFRRTFMHEPDDNFSNVWINDRTVFDAAAQQKLLGITDSGLRNGEIRRRMMEAYEPEMLQRIETTGTYRPGRSNVVVLNVVGASSSAIAEERPAMNETLLRPPTTQEARSASEESRAREGVVEFRRSSRRKFPTKKYDG